MPVGLQDIVIAGKLAWQIHSLGSSRYTSAFQEYRDFMRDIENLDTALKAIETEVKQFNALPGSTGLELSSLEIAFEGVHDTLRRCEKLLRDNPKFEWNQGFITNIQWNLDIAENVKALQTRVMFHCAKVNLIIQPLQLRIQSCMGQMLAVLHGDMDSRFREVIQRLDLLIAVTGRVENSEGKRGVPAVHDELGRRFATAASLNDSPNPFGIRKGLDAVVFHYERSTREFVSELPTMVRPTTLQYLNLMKCVWLLGLIRKMPFYRTFCLDTLAAAYVRQLERRVVAEFDRFEGSENLQAPDLEELLAEADDKFDIWPDMGIIDTAPALTEANGLEIELFKAPLQSLHRSRSQELVVFRLGESRIRFTITVTSPHVSGADRTGYEIDSRRAVLKPIYAHPNNQTSYSLSWKTAPDDSRTQELPFTTISHLKKFQEAVTSFGVVEDLSSLDSIRAKTSVFDGRGGTELGTKGRIQLWLHRQPQTTVANENASTIPISTLKQQRHNSMMSGTSKSSNSSVGTWSEQYLREKNPLSTIRSTSNGAFLDTPIPSQVVIFTMHRNQLRLISIRVDESTLINSDRCDCHKKNSSCKRVVIESTASAKKALALRIYDTNGDDDKFNVAVLAHPAHEGAKRDVEEMAVKFVAIDFADLAARQRFADAFQKVSSIMSGRMRSYYQDMKNMKSKHVYEDD